MFPLQPSEDLYGIAPDLDQPPLDHLSSTSIITQDMIPGTDCFYHHHLDSVYNPQVGSTMSYDTHIMLRDHHPNPNPSLPDPLVYGPLTSNLNNKGDGNEQEKKKKMMIHREIERQRRQEMNTLYASLRSVLPAEFLKGKRAVSDQLNAALDYINCLRKNVKGLETKRAKLKNTSNELMSDNRAIDEDQLATRDCSIAIQPYPRGVEIVVHSGDEEKLLHLSRVVEVLMDEGMDVVSCATTRINDATVYTIQSEACDSTPILDIPRLQWKLNELLITT